MSPKEKAKVESLQHELLDQMFMFNIKIDQEQLALQELNEDYKRLQDEGQNDRESFQKTVESLQKSLQDKANVLKEKEESNSILRKEAMDLVARYVILPTYQDGFQSSFNILHTKTPMAQISDIFDDLDVRVSM